MKQEKVWGAERSEEGNGRYDRCRISKDISDVVNDGELLVIKFVVNMKTP